MARRTLEERYIRKLTRTGAGRAMSITLPIEEIRALGWKDRQKVVVKRVGKKFIVSDWKKNKNK